MMLSRSSSCGRWGAVLLVGHLSLAFRFAITAVGAQTTSPGSSSAPPAAPVTAAPSLPPFPALPGILADYRGLHAGPSYAATGKELRVGHLRMLFTSGTLTAL